MLCGTSHLASSSHALKVGQEIGTRSEKTAIAGVGQDQKASPSQDSAMAPINLTDDQLASGLYGNFMCSDIFAIVDLMVLLKKECFDVYHFTLA